MHNVAINSPEKYQASKTQTKHIATDIDPLAALTAFDRERFLSFGWGAEIAPRFETITDAILFHLRNQPNAIAAEFDGKRLSYLALDHASNRLAENMRNHGVEQGDRVCLYLHRSLEMLIGIVATLKLGATYVPQHVGVAPSKMLRHVAEMTKAKVILTRSSVAALVPQHDDKELIVIDKVLEDPPNSAEIFFRPTTKSDDAALVLFTSGTTGVPNGVPVTHKNLANILLSAPGDLGMRPGQRVAQILSISFDMAAWEMLGSMANGATLVIRGKSIQETVEKVDILVATPSILNTLDVSRCTNITTAAVAGEPCPRILADSWAEICTFHNACGPSETTIINTTVPHRIDKPTLTIGSPTPNNTVYVLDNELQPLPIGMTGEMWAGGACVTAGYLGNSALTAERYRPDPFRPGHLMFHTRDLGRWTDDGELEHLGRIDDLVKIRGFRVELDGVSTALEAAEGCNQAVTLKLDNRTLVSFISPATACVEKAAQQVTDRLPYYCSPEIIIAMDTLPQTVRGKLDKRLLLQLASERLSASSAENSQ